MPHLDIAKLAAAPLVTDPFEYVVVPQFLDADTLRRVNETYPTISKGGSFPIDTLEAGTAVKEVIDELDGPAFQAAIEAKFGVDLADRPKMYSLRAYTRAKDGQIHTDSRDKIITVLLYLNQDWPHAGGRLRLLRNGRDVDDYTAEVAPDNGTLLVFRRSETSWHGHHPFEGPRRSLQMNWMTSQGSRGWHKVRHTVSAALKKLSTAP